MKKFLAIAVLALATVPALAQHHHGRGHHHRTWHPNHGWVVPALIGGAVVYAATRPDPVIVQQPPVVVQNPPVITQYPVQSCTPWFETQNPDGSITRTRTCSQ